jgi:hypothetical protein
LRGALEAAHWFVALVIVVVAIGHLSDGCDIGPQPLHGRDRAGADRLRHDAYFNT